MLELAAGGFAPDPDDGGLSEADVDRVVTIMRRWQTIGRVVALLVISAAGASLGAVIAYRTGSDVGGVPRA